MNEKVDKIIEVRRENQRQWRKKNKDKVALYNRRFWEKQAEKKLKGGTDDE